MATTLVYVKKPIFNKGTKEIFQVGAILKVDTPYWNTIKGQIEGKGFAEDLFQIDTPRENISVWPKGPDDLNGG